MIPSQGYVPGVHRPSYRELWNKLVAAIRLVREGDWAPANPGHLLANFDELAEKFEIETTTDDDKALILLTALREVTPKHYIGDCPPELSLEICTGGYELFVFRWKSESDLFKKSVMYLKFSLIGKGEKGPAFIHSIHPDHPAKATN